MSETTTKRGGKRPGSGRPRKANARTSVLSLALSAEELELIRAVGGAEWARGVVLRAARRRHSQ